MAPQAACPIAPPLPPALQAEVQSAGTNTLVAATPTIGAQLANTVYINCHQRLDEFMTVPLPHKLQRAIERGEFINLSDLLPEHLTTAESRITGSQAGTFG